MAAKKAQTPTKPDDNKAVVDGFLVCIGRYGKKDIVLATDEAVATAIFEEINGSKPESIEPLSHMPYGHDVVERHADGSTTRRLWTKR